MSRRFDGTDDEVRYPIDGTVSASFTGAMTLFLVLRRRATSAWTACIQHTDSTPGDRITFEISGTGGELDTFFYATNADVGTKDLTHTIANTTNWYALAVTKAGGTATPRFHLKDLTGATAWTHTDASGGTQGDAAAHTGGAIRVGEWLDSDDANYNLAVDAGFNTALSDSSIETITSATAEIFALTPVYLHDHNQVNATDDILDLMGNGHDATGTIGSTTDTSGIQGTAMDTATDPPGWTYGVGPITAPPIPFGQKRFVRRG